MKLILSLSLFAFFTLQFSSAAFGSVWVNTVTVTTPPATECTQTSLTVTGDLSATHQFTSSSFLISGSTITVSVEYTSGIGLPVITPFTQVVNLGLVPAGTYTVLTSGYLNGGLQSTLTTTLNVGACCGTSADFTYPTAICLGDMIQLTNSSTGQVSQEWFEDGNSASTSLDHSLTPATSGSIVIKLVTSDGTCEDSVEYSINVLDPPSISSLTPDQASYCDGETLVITNSTTNATSYSWTDNGMPASTLSTLLTTATNPGPHVFELFASNGACSDSMEITVTINVAPIITSFGASQTSICLGESFDLNSSTTGATSILWFENGAFLTNGASLTLTPTTSGTYEYLLLVANANCADSMSTTVTVNQVPAIDNSSVSQSTLCIGDAVDLTSSSSNATSFEWFENGNSIATTNNHSTTPSPEGSYTYQLIVGLNGCSDSAEHIVNVVSLPVVDLGPDTNDCFGPIILDPGVGVTFLWQDQSTNQTFTPTTTGIYSVTVTDANGCVNSDEMSFETCSGLLEKLGMNVALYPNPVVSTMTIDIDGYEGQITVLITDMNGKLISEHSEFTTGNIELDLSKLNSGVYYIHLATTNANSILKVIKE